MKKPITPRLLVAALTLSLGLAANSFAMPRGEYHGHHGGPGMGMPGHHQMIHGRAMTRLHDELKLDAKQEALWKDAEKSAQEQRDAMRERFAKDHAEIKAQLDQSGADLRAIAKRMDDLRAEHMKQRDAVRERWFAVYDSLNAEQKEKARVFFKNGMERMERMGERAKERQGRGQPANPAPKN